MGVLDGPLMGELDRPLTGGLDGPLMGGLGRPIKKYKKKICGIPQIVKYKILDSENCILTTKS